MKHPASFKTSVPSLEGNVVLDALALRILAFLTKNLGYSRVPKVVPMLYIAKAMDCTYDRVRERITKLVSGGFLEKWTTKHPKGRITYYRIPYKPPFNRTPN
jgi:hypothetical protein